MTANTPHHDLIAPDLDIFEALAAAALAGLPAPYDAAARQIALRIVDFAPDDILAGM